MHEQCVESRDDFRSELMRKRERIQAAPRPMRLKSGACHNRRGASSESATQNYWIGASSGSFRTNAQTVRKISPAAHK